MDEPSKENDRTMAHEDLLLARRVVQGEEAAFEQMFEANAQRLFAYAVSQVGRDRELARELVQATFCKAVEKLYTYRGEAPLASWLRAVCRFEISAHRRREKRIVGESAEDLLERRSTDEAFAERIADPAADYERDERSARVRSSLGELSERYRQVLLWKYSQGLPVNEIAQRLQVSAKAAESLLTRARLAFRQQYQEFGGDWLQS